MSQCDRNPISSSFAKVLIVLNFQVNFWAIQAGRVFHLSQRIGVVCVATWELLDERWEFLLIATRNVPRVLTIPPTPNKNYLLPTYAASVTCLLHNSMTVLTIHFHISSKISAMF